MEIRNKPLRTLVNVAVLSLTATGAAHAGAFALYTESSPAAIGNYAAGAAAEAADASIGWYNPAGLPLLRKQEVVFGGVGVFPETEITGVSTFNAPPAPYVQTFGELDGGENGFVPSFHYALPLGENAAFGLSMVSPFGLATDWGPTSPVRYQATFTELITVDISPELGAKVTDNFAVGAGLDLQYARVKFNQIIGLPTLANAFGNPFDFDSLSYNKGSSFGVGYHVGVMGLFNDEHTRVGLNYQSQMRHTFNGFSRLSGPLANAGNIFEMPPETVRTNINLASNPIKLPDVLTLSAYHDLNQTWAVLGSVIWTGWSSFQVIQLNNVAAPAVSPLGEITPVSISSVAPQNYKDAWRAALGVNYHVNEAWMLRVGGGYDETPTTDVHRDIRLPDTNRWALSVGAHYQMKPSLGVDVGYTHLFSAENSTLNDTVPLSATSSVNVSGTAKATADLVGAQLVWVIDQPVVATK